MTADPPIGLADPTMGTVDLAAKSPKKPRQLASPISTTATSPLTSTLGHGNGRRSPGRRLPCHPPNFRPRALVVARRMGGEAAWRRRGLVAA